MKSESNSLLSKDTHISANECHDVYLAEAQSLLEKLTWNIEKLLRFWLQIRKSYGVTSFLEYVKWVSYTRCVTKFRFNNGKIHK